ncbi:EAL domain-containing protein [Paenibacillus sp. LMG 31456]|uniref:EAL domain-containing protein n=1 Tax=Paenibacillus foliorum TaxID=2654974 RepID=A0A972GSV8_9BACL|nr:GGDEF domain-containing phosphodiesterase [Paenibacillus foliorum]NOU93839.1 EAL domain-containing protein [Paenibacillus foliorum]
MDESVMLAAVASHPLFMFSGDGVILLDSQGNIRQMNEESCRLTGVESGYWLNHSINELLDMPYRDSFSRHLEGALQGRSSNMEADIRHRAGHTIQLTLRFIPEQMEHLNLAYVVLRDVTELKRSVQLIEHMAYHDTLTGLPNRTMFQIQLAQMLAAGNANTESVSFAILLIGLDRLHIVNDSLGHNWGDLLLKQVGERLQLMMGRDHLVSRIGNHEFAVIYKRFADTSDIIEKTRLLHQNLLSPFMVREREFVVVGNIGLAVFPTDGTDMDSLMRHAALVQTVEKENGQGIYRLQQDDVTSDSLQRLELEYDLRKALKRDEFELYYQPQYNIQTNQLIGMEALIRWHHPERGMVPPGKFIPLAEETGLIVPIGDWVIRTACLQNKQWQDAGMPPITVSVNLSLRQFQKHNLIGDIVKTLKETGLDPRYLELEITESMAMDNIERVIRKLNELKDLGIRISMDDFGTGYSSLQYLRKIPIHKLKIDQSFIRDITQDPDNAAIVSTIIAMANHLKLEVVAEGVETLEDLRFLLNKDCRHAQGYYFSKPLPKDQFEQHFRQQ